MKIEEPCTCLYYLQEQAKRIKKESSLYRVKCKGCGREFLSNTEKEYCFECEEKREKWRKKKENLESGRNISLYGL